MLFIYSGLSLAKTSSPPLEKFLLRSRPPLEKPIPLRGFKLGNFAKPNKWNSKLDILRIT